MWMRFLGEPDYRCPALVNGREYKVEVVGYESGCMLMCIVLENRRVVHVPYSTLYSFLNNWEPIFGEVGRRSR